MTEKQNLPTVASTPAMEPIPYAPAYGGGADKEARGGLKRHLGTVVRYKWLVVGLTILGAIIGVVASQRAAVQYAARVVLWFEADGDRESGPIQAAGLLQNDAWTQLIRTPAVLDSIVYAERLYIGYAVEDRDVMRAFMVDSQYLSGRYRLEVDKSGQTAELRRRDGVLIESAAVGSAFGRPAGFIWQPDRAALRPEREVPFSVRSPGDAAILLSSALETEMATGGTFMTVKHTGSDPTRVAHVLNAVADRYVDVAAGLKSAKLKEIRDILNSQLAYAEENLRQSEMAQETFGVQTVTLPSDRSTPVSPGLESTRQSVFSSFFDLRIQRETLQKDRDAILRIIGNGVDSLSVDALSVIPSVNASPELSQALQQLATSRGELRAMRQQYTDSFPAVRRLAAAVRETQTITIPRLAQRLVNDLDARAAVAQNTINSASEELRAIPPRAIEEARLARAVTSAENMYRDLSGRYENARLAAETSVPDVRILARAPVPEYPSSDPRIPLLFGGVAGGIAAGVMLAILLGRMDPRLQYAEQVTEDLRLGIVGAIPDLPASRRKLASADNNAKVIEAFRGVRHNLMHAYGLGRPMILTITSPGPGDGKTFVTSNLALAFADLGLKTLIVDGDTRRGELHRLLDTQRKPGLTDFLQGDCGSDEIICSTHYPLVNLIPGGTRRANAPELLASARLGELLADIRSKYQVILIDSPPLGAGVDPLILGSLSGNLVLVMRTGKTDRALAEAKLQMLDRLPIRILGAVLNGFESHLAYQYYSYIPGYEARDEEGESNGNLLQSV